MSWIGRYQLGGWVPLTIECYDSSSDDSASDTAPEFTVYNASGTEVANGRLRHEVGDEDHVYTGEVRLTSSFAAGMYWVLFEFTDGLFTGQELQNFEVVGGGNSSGAYIALHAYEAPHANILVGQLDGGTLEARKNPSIPV